jgi:hypothetical protein
MQLIARYRNAGFEALAPTWDGWPAVHSIRV